MQNLLPIVLALWCLSPLWFVKSDGAHAGQPRVPQARRTATVALVGDVMLGGGVAEIIEARGADAPFAAIAQTLDAADATVGNLECALSTRGRPTTAKSTSAVKARREWLLRGAPMAASGLAHARFAAMSLANNHTMDFGPAALHDTMAYLHAEGIGTAGAGPDAASASQPAYFGRGGVRFALLAYSDIIPRGFAAGKHSPGVAVGRSMDSGLIDAAAIGALKRDVRLARQAADVIIVYEHWGVERVGTPTDEQVSAAHAAIDAGATVVVGAHPHVLGPIESYRGGIIAYSLGNFVFDAFPGAGTRSAVLVASFESGRLTSWRAMPVEIVGGEPKLVLPSTRTARAIETALAWRPHAVQASSVPRGAVIKGKTHGH
jgi:poly-gamma-glutamate capsule biosynthesis protein CapA/YwtB (metallophosphatase superfamily)